MTLSHVPVIRQCDVMIKNIDANIKGYVHTLETFGLVDGPGVRFVVFLSGCRMRCKFCHNPDTWSIAGKEWTAGDLFRHVRKYKSYWKNNGGITVSGGEPLLQMDFVTEFFSLAKSENIHTTLDTAGEPFRRDPEYLRRFNRLMSVTDLIMLDLKEMNPILHKELTGVDNSNILDMAEYLSDNGKKLWIRHVLVPGLTDDEADLTKMHKFISGLKTVEKVEVLPYHTLGIAKWKDLNIPYPLEGVPVPTDEQVERANILLHTNEY